MDNVTFKTAENVLTINLSGHIDSANASEVEEEINRIKAENPAGNLVIDTENLDYISSAGLRIILRLRKECPDLKVINVSSEIYEIFDMTGFTEMIKIEKAYKTLSVEGCEVIGQGANGKVYRIDRDTIVKYYMNPDSLEDIQRERDLARKAFVMGIPTAIPYDIVRIGEGYGSVFELLNATSFAKILINEPERFDEVVSMSVDLLKKIHSTELKPGEMPDMRDNALVWADFCRNEIGTEAGDKLCAMVEAIPVDLHMMHGDFHIKNVMLQDGEVLLIDMDTLCTGNPIFELGQMYNAYRGFSETDHENVKRFLGIDYETADRFWRSCLSGYLGTDDEAKLDEVEKKAKIVGYSRILRREIRHGKGETEYSRNQIAFLKENLPKLVMEVDSLLI